MHKFLMGLGMPEYSFKDGSFRDVPSPYILFIVFTVQRIHIQIILCTAIPLILKVTVTGVYGLPISLP